MRQVLVVDHDEAFCDRLGREIREAGHQPILHADWQGVLELLEGPARVDAMVTDLSLRPGAPNGVSLARMARRRRPDLKLVFVTAFPGLMEEADRLGPVFLKTGALQPVVAALD